MHKLAAILSLFVLFASGHSLRAEEKPAKGRIVSLNLFKNGLVVVRVEVALDGPGVYVLDRVPDPIHGTYWVQSDAEVESRVQTREVDVPAPEAAGGNLQVELAGKKATVHLRGGQVPPVSGVVVQPPQLRAEPADTDAAMPRPDPGSPAAPPGRYLVIQTARGRAYIEASEIAFVEAEGAEGRLKRKKPVLLLTLKGENRGPATVGITYLARGMAWAPSYRVDIGDPKTLRLEQGAVVRNELTAVRDCELQLISGYPSIQFAHVTSPFSPRTSWEAFFQQLARPAQDFSALTTNAVVAQRVGFNRRAMDYAPALGATPTGEGVDLHYQSIGKRSLAKGEALALTLARGSAAYQRIVEWLIPDTRDEFGRHAGRSRGGRDEEDGSEEPWDALRFKNPLPFPMTTGPAVIVANGRFNGQRTSYWVNAGEETTLRVTKALSVRTRCVEHENQHNGNEDRQVVYIGGQRYRRSQVEGEVAVSNHRKELITLVIRRRFSGDLLTADGSPQTSLREEGVWSVNKRNELLWTLALKPGEEKKLTYRYAVLVHF
jgi:hypothetical protein